MMKNIRYVVFHRPGPKWQPGVPPFEQAGLDRHVGHYATLLKDQKLMMGGPFMDEKSGGMMITEPGVTEAELRQFAAEDPAVKTGLLEFEIRPWMAGLQK